MKNQFFYPILVFLFIFLSCSEDDNATPTTPNPSTSINKIMPLGASRVAGARPEYESYRYDLWKLLVDGAYDFDFIGTAKDGASYPDFKGLSFDIDHEGRGGINSTEILTGLNGWINEAGIPDIVLFSSPGGNDGIDNYTQTLANINAIIDAIQTANQNVTILIELPAPPLTSEQTQEFLTFYNQALQDIARIATQQTTATSKVMAVDMQDGFNDSFLADDVHYNAAGAAFIADKYFTILKDILK